jgi:peptidyl-prolyl cis-trans isomerase SurA
MKMKKYYSLLTIILLNSVLSFTQNNSANSWIFSFGPHKVSYEEFRRGLMKNQGQDKKNLNKDEIHDYLNLYTNFKLKVQHAHDLRMDTLKSFKSELGVYQKQIARPFLTDKEVTDLLMMEAYERLKYDVNASHILIMVKNFDNVGDTLRAFRYLDSIRNLITSGKMDFETAAQNFSQDPSAKTNYGNLDYFTAFQMVYPFENMAFNTKVGEISPIFKTDFGYHILKVNDIRPNLGEIRVAHLMLLPNTNASEEDLNRLMEKAQGIYDKIVSGEKNFDEMVRQYSEDLGTKNNGGILEPFRRTSQYPVEFKNAAFNLQKDGDISRPIKTNYGIHIVKRVELIPPLAYDKMKAKLSQDIARDFRSYKNTEALYKKVATQLNLKHNNKTYKHFIKKRMNNDYAKGTWQYKAGKDSVAELFSFANIKIPVKDFAKFLQENQTIIDNPNLKSVVDKKYESFVMRKVMEHYEQNLEIYNEDYRFLLKEYKEGILLFSLMDDVVWTKSMQDSAGLEAFFKSRNDRYQWGERFDIDVFATSEKAVLKSVTDMINKKISNDSIINFFKIKDPLALTVRKGKFSEGDDDLVDAHVFNKLQAAQATDGNYFVVVEEEGIYYIHRVNAYLKPSAKTLEEVRGPVISEYQDKLEEEWIKGLKAKYPVVVNQVALDKLIKELTQ